MNGSGSLVDAAKFMLPKVPSMLRAGASHALGLSATSSQWDMQTAITVDVLRSTLFTDPPSAIGKAQATTLKDPGPKGKMWTAPATLPAPSDSGTREAIFKAIADMGDGKENYTKPDNADLKVEWTGFRSDAKSAEDPLPDLEPKQRYEKLMADPNRTSKATFLYFHGGAYYLCSFATHRLPVSRLAKACNGRALNVEYRLAPQAAFPSQLLDGLNAYLYLLYPPPGALHEPVPASEIIFAGDSAGGNLSFALLQLLLQLHRSNPNPTKPPTITHNGKQVEVPLPAGVTGLSPWLDISRSSPSLISNAKYDYLPPPSHDAGASFPHDDVWPTTPPRGDTFCDLSLLDHPLVSPLCAKDWSGSPPLWITAGDELLYDEGAVVAAEAKRQGVMVVWEHYEAMPHVFSMLIPHLKSAQDNYASWGKFAKEAVEGKVVGSSTFVKAKTGETSEVELVVGKEAPFGIEEAVKNVRDAKFRREKGWEKEAKTMPKLG